MACLTDRPLLSLSLSNVSSCNEAKICKQHRYIFCILGAGCVLAVKLTALPQSLAAGSG